MQVGSTNTFQTPTAPQLLREGSWLSPSLSFQKPLLLPTSLPSLHYRRLSLLSPLPHTPIPIGPPLPSSIITTFKLPSFPVVSAPYWVGSRLQKQKTGPDFQGVSMSPFPRKAAAELLTTDKTSGPCARKPSHPSPPAKRAVQGHASHTPPYVRAPCFNH